MKDEKKTNNSHQDKSDQFRTEIESKLIDLDGPELLQFAMIFVQGALQKSQVCDLYECFLELFSQWKPRKTDANKSSEWLNIQYCHRTSSQGAITIGNA